MFKRNFSIDFVKSYLVFIMLLHHGIDFLISNNNYYYFYKYLRFVTGSFVFISGFLISNVYINKYNINDNIMYKRLLDRAIKLLLIFTILNIFINNTQIVEKIWEINLDMKLIFETIFTIYIAGDYRVVSFEILVPIAYTLICSGFLIYLLKYRFNKIKFISFILVVYCSFKFFNMKEAYNLRYLSLGLCGLALGFIEINKIENFFKTKFRLKGIVIISSIYLFLLHIFKLSYPFYIISILVNLSIAYFIGENLAFHNIVENKLLLIGRYSLISYLFQVMCYKIISKILIMIPNVAIRYIIGFLTTTTIMYMFIEFVEYSRKRIIYFNKIYKLVFL